MKKGRRNQFRDGMQCSFCHSSAPCILTRTAFLSECLHGGWVGEIATETVQEMREEKEERLGRVDLG